MTRAILLLAAGASSRMRGRDKLVEDVDGKPLLRLMAERALEVCAQVFVTLPENSPLRSNALDGLKVTRVEVPNAKEGLSASIKTGISAIGSQSDLMILPADLPEVTANDLAKAWRCFDQNGGEKVVRCVDNAGQAGHPVVLPGFFLVRLMALTGDQGAAPLIHSHGFVPCPLPDDHATTDLDTPEDWQDWRRKRKKMGED